MSLSRNSRRSMVVRTKGAPAEGTDRAGVLDIVNLWRMDSETTGRERVITQPGWHPQSARQSARSPARPASDAMWQGSRGAHGAGITASGRRRLMLAGFCRFPLAGNGVGRLPWRRSRADARSRSAAYRSPGSELPRPRQTIKTCHVWGYAWQEEGVDPSGSPALTPCSPACMPKTTAPHGAAIAARCLAGTPSVSRRRAAALAGRHGTSKASPRSLRPRGWTDCIGLAVLSAAGQHANGFWTWTVSR